MTRSLLSLCGRWVLLVVALSVVGSTALASTSSAQAKPRARDLGVPFPGTPGPDNAITDVEGIHVGHTTLISGEGELRVGEGPVRTGVTAILPRADAPADPVFGGWFALNGNGEMTGTTWIEESGFLEGPIAITNTHSVGVVRDAIIAWQRENGTAFQPWSLPVVAETYDGSLNDINGFHVKPEHLRSAIANASGGPVQEGNVGGGTGMSCLGFKCGIGTSSRAGLGEGDYTVGVLVQANFGGGRGLTIAGVPVGMEFAREQEAGGLPASDDAFAAGGETTAISGFEINLAREGRGSIIIVVATDAPLLPHQLKRIARRASLGVARTGGISGGQVSGAPRKRHAGSTVPVVMDERFVVELVGFDHEAGGSVRSETHGGADHPLPGRLDQCQAQRGPRRSGGGVRPAPGRSACMKSNV